MGQSTLSAPSIPLTNLAFSPFHLNGDNERRDENVIENLRGTGFSNRDCDAILLSSKDINLWQNDSL